MFASDLIIFVLEEEGDMVSLLYNFENEFEKCEFNKKNFKTK